MTEEKQKTVNMMIDKIGELRREASSSIEDFHLMNAENSLTNYVEEIK